MYFSNKINRLRETGFMKNMIRVSLAALALSLFALPAFADVARVVVVNTDNVEGYVAELEVGKKILEKAGATSTVRAWLATSAGPNAGHIVVAITYDDMMHYAKEYQMLNGNKELQKWLKGLDAIRTITSDSLYQEL